MEEFIENSRGVHPGLILERELKKRKLKKGPFALSLLEYPQTLNDITKGKRGLTPALSLKIDAALGFEEGTMLILQAYYEIKREKEKEPDKQNGKQKQPAEDLPDFPVLRKILFWDTDMSKVDWHKQYKMVIERVFNRGNSDEKNEMLRFYGKDKINEVTGGTGGTNNWLNVMRSRKGK
jgi:plasmid maintenance system antidote protein VapI